MLNEEFTRRPEQWGHKKVVHTVVPSYHDRPGYINAMAALVDKEVAQFSPEDRKKGVQVGAKTSCDLFDISITLIGLLPTLLRDSTRFGIDLTLC